MKKIIIIGSLIIFTSFQSFSDESYSMKCRDNSFFYNMLEITTEDQGLKFTSTTTIDSKVYKNLFSHKHSSNLMDIRNITLSFKIPTKNCKTSPFDPKIISCRKKLLPILIEGFKGDEKITENKDLEYTLIQVRKVTSMSNLKKIGETVSYELLISSYKNRNLLTQRYSTEVSTNATHNCEVKGELR